MVVYNLNWLFFFFDRGDFRYGRIMKRVEAYFHRVACEILLQTKGKISPSLYTIIMVLFCPEGFRENHFSDHFVQQV